MRFLSVKRKGGEKEGKKESVSILFKKMLTSLKFGGGPLSNKI